MLIHKRICLNNKRNLYKSKGSISNVGNINDNDNMKGLPSLCKVKLLLLDIFLIVC